MDDTLSAEEQSELADIIRQEERAGEITERLQAMIDTTRQPEWNGDRLDEMVQHVLQSDKTGEVEEVTRIRPMRRWIVAAASIALLIAAGLYFGTQREARQPVAGMPSVKIAPGSNKAVLTLADGSEIQLDSSGNQVIRQGSASIRQAGGQLQYTAGNGTAINSYNTLTIPRGGQFQVTLPDGSRVWLNSASVLRYPVSFPGKERTVELQGQGYFEIAADASRPFRVKVNDMEVQVLGTHFDIMAYPDENSINTTLLQGAVKVVRGKESVLLMPGQQAVAASTEHPISVRDADTKNVIAWKSGLFVFNNTDLGTILREIARWYDVEIVDNMTGSNHERFGGSISRQQDLSAVLQLLEAGGNCHFRVEGRKIILQK